MALMWFLGFLIVWHVFGPVSYSQPINRYAYALIRGSVELTFPIPYEDRNKIINIIQVDPDTKALLGIFRMFESGKSTFEEPSHHFKGRISRHELTGLTLRATLTDVTLEDRGVYRCYQFHFNNLIEGCGVTLVILGTPSRAQLTVPNIPTVGRSMRLYCKHFRNNWPNVRLFNYTVTWTFENEHFESAKEVAYEGNSLVIPKVLKRHRGTQFTCETRDVIPQFSGTPPLSDTSNKFLLKPQYAPEKTDMTLTPTVEDEGTVIKRADEVMKCICQVNCEPPCFAYWSYKPPTAESFGNLTMMDSDILRILVSRGSEGTYRCTAFNKLGNTFKSFKLEVHYLQEVTITVNDRPENVVEIVENDPAKLECSTIADPIPTLTLKSTLKTLVTSAQLKPTTSKAADGSTSKKYTLSHTIQTTDCDSPSNYFCEAMQGEAVVEKNISLAIHCEIRKADILGLVLKSEYKLARESTVAVEFVLKAFPEPSVASVTTSLKGEEKTLEPGTDYDMRVGSQYNGDTRLTRFTFKTLHKLKLWDNGRTFTLHFKAGTFKNAFSFKVMVTSGGTTPLITFVPSGEPKMTNVTPSDTTTTTTATTTTTESKHSSTTLEDEEKDDGSLKISPILLVTGVIVVIAVLTAFYFLLITRRDSMSSVTGGLQVLGSKDLKKSSSSKSRSMHNV